MNFTDERAGGHFSRPTVRRILTLSPAGAHHKPFPPPADYRLGCWCNWTCSPRLVGGGDPNWPWTTLPARRSTPSPHRRGHETSCCGWPDRIPLAYTTATPSSSTTPARRRRRGKPPSSPVACRNWASGNLPAHPKDNGFLGELDKAMWLAVREVTTWPDHDLFTLYGYE